MKMKRERQSEEGGRRKKNTPQKFDAKIEQINGI